MVWKPSQKVWDQGVSAIPVRQIETTLHCCHAGLPSADLRKLKYALDMCTKDDPFISVMSLEPALDEAIAWQAARTPAEVMEEREKMISQIEFAGSELKASGKCAEWFSGCDEILKHATKGVNGFLMQELLLAAQHCDKAAAEIFRLGGDCA